METRGKQIKYSSQRQQEASRRYLFPGIYGHLGCITFDLLQCNNDYVTFYIYNYHLLSGAKYSSNISSHVQVNKCFLFPCLWSFFILFYLFVVLFSLHAFSASVRSSRLFSSQQGVPRIWRPAVECAQCLYPNDNCFRFCQQCGYKRISAAQPNTSKSLKVDIESIDSRIEELNKAKSSRAYEKQKSQLESELQVFLESIPTCPKTIHSASPHDILRFLVWKDAKGRTQVHADHCPFIGQQGRLPCNCPTRLSAGSVDSLIGKLRSIFNIRGRTGNWDDHTFRGNPAAHHSVKAYLQSI